jgi:enterochelin esterase-like enzyme
LARHDVIGTARRHPKLFDRILVWIDGGDGDPFRSADQALAQALRTGVHYHVWPGGHNAKYWDAHMPSYLRFYSRALAACSTVSQ